LINIGIIQESHLSPILFLFFNAPLVELFNNPRPYKDTRVFVFAYAGDASLLVVLPTYKNNLVVLEKLHTMLLEWAALNGVTFSPFISAVMHFLSMSIRPRACYDYSIRSLVPGMSGPVEVKKFRNGVTSPWSCNRPQAPMGCTHLPGK
jgi:hypothetical protein